MTFKNHCLVEEVTFGDPFEDSGVVCAMVERTLSIRCILGDIRLWVGDPWTSSCLVSLLRRFSQPTLSLSIAHVRQSGPDCGLDFPIKGLAILSASSCRPQTPPSRPLQSASVGPPGSDPP